MKTFFINQSLLFFLKNHFPKSLEKNSTKIIKKNFQIWRKESFLFQFQRLNESLNQSSDPIQNFQMLLEIYEHLLESFVCTVFYNGFQAQELDLFLSGIQKKGEQSYLPSPFIIVDLQQKIEWTFFDNPQLAPVERIHHMLLAKYKFELKLVNESKAKIDKKEFSNFVKKSLKKISILQ